MKQTIVVRKDLKMRKGKIASQVAHASMGVLLKGVVNKTGFAVNGDRIYTVCVPENTHIWLEDIFTKIVLGCDSLEDILNLEIIAKEQGIPYCVVTDSGKTVFDGVPTITCIAIGPYPDVILEDITKDYKLL